MFFFNTYTEYTCMQSDLINADPEDLESPISDTKIAETDFFLCILPL